MLYIGDSITPGLDSNLPYSLDIRTRHSSFASRASSEPSASTETTLNGQCEAGQFVQSSYPNHLSRNDGKTGRTLVLCFDGTCDRFDECNSNVVQFAKLLYMADQKKQMVYYQVRMHHLLFSFTAQCLVAWHRHLSRKKLQ
jgi:hypothetical protein